MDEIQASDAVAARTTAIAYLREAEVSARADAFLRDGSPAERRAVATAIARRPRPSALHKKLLELLDDPDTGVRCEAIAASGVVRLREFIPALIPHLRTAQARDSARAALAAFGNRAVGTIGDYLSDDTVPLLIRRELPLVLAEVGTQEAANELLRAPYPTDAILRLRLLEAQNKIRAHDAQVVFPRANVREALQREVEIFVQLHQHVVVWRAEPPSRGRDILLASLEKRLDSTFARILMRLGLIYPSQAMALGTRAFDGPSRVRSHALESLAAALLPEDRRLLVPLLENPDRGPLDADSQYRLRPLDRASSLAALVSGTDSWLQACALYFIGALHLAELAPAARDALRAVVPIVRETAAWSLQRLESV